MTGHRRGENGSGRPTRAASRPKKRQRLLAQRLNNPATDDRHRVGAASAYLRARMADPDVPAADAHAAAEQAIRFLITLADRL